MESEIIISSSQSQRAANFLRQSELYSPEELAYLREQASEGIRRGKEFFERELQPLKAYLQSVKNGTPDETLWPY
jgi:hypothetical protein